MAQEYLYIIFFLFLIVVLIGLVCFIITTTIAKKKKIHPACLLFNPDSMDFFNKLFDICM